MNKDKIKELLKNPEILSLINLLIPYIEEDFHYGYDNCLNEFIESYTGEKPNPPFYNDGDD